MKNISEIKINNQQAFLAQIKKGIIDKTIDPKKLTKIIWEAQKVAKEKELAAAYQEWANDKNEQRDIKSKY